MKMHGAKRNLLKKMELLIIDEVSMLRADLLDAIDVTLRRVRRRSEPFGGVQILFIGDLMQAAAGWCGVGGGKTSAGTILFDPVFFCCPSAWRRAAAVH